MLRYLDPFGKSIVLDDGPGEKVKKWINYDPKQWSDDDFSGKSIATTDCDCNVEFKFNIVQNGWYKTTKAQIGGVFVHLQVSMVEPKGACCCKDLRLAQAVRQTKRGKTVEPMGQPYSGWPNGKSPGWIPDFIPGNNDPYWDAPGKDHGFEHGSKGKYDGEPETWSPAELWDAPGVDRDGYAGELITCAFCDGKIVGCVRWSYSTTILLNADGSPVEHPVTGDLIVVGKFGGQPKISCTPPEEFVDAFDRWNEGGGNVHIPVR